MAFRKRYTKKWKPRRKRRYNKTFKSRNRSYRPRKSKIGVRM